MFINYSLDQLGRHWSVTTAEFAATYADCQAVFEAITRCSTPVLNAIAKPKSLESNCAYLLLAKSLNHTFATLILLQRGLMIDAALASRNGIETLLLLELLSKQPDLCQQWAAGDEFRPSDVRKRLSKITSVQAGEVIITVSSDTYEEVKFVYGWLSQITHANLQSLQYVTTSTGPNDFAIHIGGSLVRSVAIAITKTLGATFGRALPTCSAVHDSELLKSQGSEFQKLESMIKSLGKESSR